MCVSQIGARSVTKLHSWAFDRLYQYLEYKGETRGVEVLKENEWNTSKTCSRCGDDTSSNRVERGLYVYSSYELVANADCNEAESMRQKITLSPHGEDRSTGCVVVRETGGLSSSRKARSTSGKLLCNWSPPNQAWSVGRRSLCDI